MDTFMPMATTIRHNRLINTFIGDVINLSRKQEIYALQSDCALVHWGERKEPANMALVNIAEIKDIAKFTDVLYLGGTKNGGLFGEAIVITNESLQSDFRYFLKQRGALLAKGAAIGIQFLALLENNLYDELAIRANQTARKLADGIMEMNIGFYSDPESNQVFPILPLDVSEKMHSLYGFYDWKMIDNESVANRLVVSWATPEHIITDFLEDLRSFIK